MEIGSKTIEFKSYRDVLTIFLFGDLHIASAAFAEKEFKSLVQKIKKTDNSLWFGMGDLGENIVIKDIRFDQTSLRELYQNKLHRLPQEEANELCRLLDPIKDKCCGLLVGGHEDSLRRKFSYDLTWELCNHFNWRNLSGETLYRLYIGLPGKGYSKIDIFLAHGYGTGRKWGSRLNKISDIAAGVRAEIYAVAHQHSQGAIEEVELSLPYKGNLELIQKERIGLIVPSFYKTYQEGMDTYASKALYPPSVIGHSEIFITYKYEGTRCVPKINTIL